MNTGNCSDDSGQPNKKIEEKLNELEHDLDRKSGAELPASVSSQDLIKPVSLTPVKDDLYYFSGIALIFFAVLVFFQHIRLGTGLIQALGIGTGGFGLLILPLLIGIGLIVYNQKNKIGYAIVAITSALIFFAVLSSLIMTFAPISLLGLIVLLAPLAVGSAFVVKGMGGVKGVEYHMRAQGLLKSEIKPDQTSK